MLVGYDFEEAVDWLKGVPGAPADPVVRRREVALALSLEQALVAQSFLASPRRIGRTARRRLVAAARREDDELDLLSLRGSLVARAVRRRALSYLAEDAASEGTLALLSALRSYDWRLAQLSTYAARFVCRGVELAGREPVRDALAHVACAIAPVEESSDHARSGRVIPEAAAVVGVSAGAEEEVLAQAAAEEEHRRAARLASEVAGLPPAERRALELRLAGLGRDLAAGALGLSLSGFAELERRAREMCRHPGRLGRWAQAAADTAHSRGALPGQEVGWQHNQGRSSTVMARVNTTVEVMPCPFGALELAEVPLGSLREPLVARSESGSAEDCRAIVEELALCLVRGGRDAVSVPVPTVHRETMCVMDGWLSVEAARSVSRNNDKALVRVYLFDGDLGEAYEKLFDVESRLARRHTRAERLAAMRAYFLEFPKTPKAVLARRFHLGNALVSSVVHEMQEDYGVSEVERSNGRTQPAARVTAAAADPAPDPAPAVAAFAPAPAPAAPARKVGLDHPDGQLRYMTGQVEEVSARVEEILADNPDATSTEIAARTGFSRYVIEHVLELLHQGKTAAEVAAVFLDEDPRERVRQVTIRARTAIEDLSTMLRQLEEHGLEVPGLVDAKERDALLASMTRVAAAMHLEVVFATH